MEHPIQVAGLFVLIFSLLYENTPYIAGRKLGKVPLFATSKSICGQMVLLKVSNSVFHCESFSDNILRNMQPLKVGSHAEVAGTPSAKVRS